MEKENLKLMLKQLHDGLLETDGLDAELRSLLEELGHDISHVLANQDTPDDPVFSALSDRSLALSARFAARHPKLEPALRELGSMLEKICV